MDKENAYNTDMWNKTSEFNERMMRAQMENASRMQTEQNVWNSEQAQYQRYKATGLNPLGFGGNSSTSPAIQAGSASMSPQSSAAPPMPAQYANMINPRWGDMLTNIAQGAELGKVFGETRKLKEETKNIEVDRLKKLVETQLNKAQIAKLAEEVVETRQRISQINLDNEAKEIINKYLDRNSALQLRHLELENLQTQKQTDKIKSEISKIKTDISLSESERKKVEQFVSQQSKLFPQELQEKFLKNELSSKQSQEFSNKLKTFDLEYEKLKNELKLSDAQLLDLLRVEQNLKIPFFGNFKFYTPAKLKENKLMKNQQSRYNIRSDPRRRDFMDFPSYVNP